MEQHKPGKLELDLRAHIAALEDREFVYRKLLEGASRQISRGPLYRLPPGGHIDCIEDRRRDVQRAATFGTPFQQFVLSWTGAGGGEAAALCFDTAARFPAQGVPSPYWAMFFPREFAPRRHDVAVVPIFYRSGLLVPPEAAVVFGPTDLFWRSVTSRSLLRMSIAVRESLCLSNPRFALLNRSLAAAVLSGQPYPEPIVTQCAQAIGVFESFCHASGWDKIQPQPIAPVK